MDGCDLIRETYERKKENFEHNRITVVVVLTHGRTLTHTHTHTTKTLHTTKNKSALILFI